MRSRSKRSLVMVIALVAALAGCAGGGNIQTASVQSGNQDILAIVAGRFRFWPNAISVDKPGPLTLEIKNVTGSVQNFTLKDTTYKTIENVNVPPGTTTIINVDFPVRGVYQFYSNLTLRSFVGMNGQISVGQ